MKIFELIGKFFNSVFISAIMSMMVYLYNSAPLATFIYSIFFYFLVNYYELEKYLNKNIANFCRFFAEASIGICLFCFIYGYFTSQKKLPELSVILAILAVSFVTKYVIYQKMERH